MVIHIRGVVTLISRRIVLRVRYFRSMIRIPVKQMAAIRVMLPFVKYMWQPLHLTLISTSRV